MKFLLYLAIISMNNLGIVEVRTKVSWVDSEKECAKMALEAENEFEKHWSNLTEIIDHDVKCIKVSK